MTAPRYDRHRLARLLAIGWQRSEATDERERLLDAVTFTVRRSQPGETAFFSNNGEKPHEHHDHDPL